MADYDIFISYRNTDDNGNITLDVEMAESLYYALLKKGYNPFFSKYSIGNIGRSDYMTIINEALESARILVAVGTSRENLTSRWVKREINMFSALMMREEEGARTLVSYRSPDFPVDELPTNLADLQSYADEKAVVRFIDASLKNASGFRNEGDGTHLLYEGSNTTSLRQSAVPPLIAGQGLQPGDVLDGRYYIMSKIGQGGMACVFLAADRRTNRKYAVKEVRLDSVLDATMALQGLTHETDLLMRINHPSIPKIIDMITTADAIIAVMEYVEGKSMQKVLFEAGPQPEEKVLNIARQLTQVLEYLHNLDTPIIYRDLKPGNIMLQPDGKVMLIDFGTAREYKQNSLEDTTCLGTIGYAAPEQFGGMGQTDCRTDIYNLGVTLYYMVTGRNPAEPPYEIVPVRQIKPELSAGLEIILQKCTQKDPNRRYQSAKELLEAIENIHILGKRSLFFRTPKDKVPAKRPKKQKQISSNKKQKSAGQRIPQSTNPGEFAIPGAPAPIGLGSPVVPIRVPAGTYSAEEMETYSAQTGVLKPPEPPTVTIIPPLQWVPDVGEVPVSNDPNLKEIMEKLAALDPESQQIIRNLIDRLSR